MFDTPFHDWGMLKKRDGVDAHEDYIYCGDPYHVASTHDHSRRFLRLIDAQGITPGNWIRVDCLKNYDVTKPDVAHCIAQVHRVVGSMLELKSAMEHLPLPGGEVVKIVGYSQAWVDLRIRDHMEKNKLKLLENGRFIHV